MHRIKAILAILSVLMFIVVAFYCSLSSFFVDNGMYWEVVVFFKIIFFVMAILFIIGLPTLFSEKINQCFTNFFNRRRAT
jgi:hypothetical protein